MNGRPAPEARPGPPDARSSASPPPSPGAPPPLPGVRGAGRGPAEGPCTRSRPRDPPPSPSNRRRSRSCSATSCRKPKVAKCWLPWRQETRQSREPAAPLPRRQRARRVSVLELGRVRWRPQAQALPCAGGAGRVALRCRLSVRLSSMKCAARRTSVSRGPAFRREGSEAGPVGSAARGEQSRVSGALSARVTGRGTELPRAYWSLGTGHCLVLGSLIPWAPAGQGTWGLWLLELGVAGRDFPETRPRAELPAFEDPGPSAASSCVRARPPSCCLTLSPRTRIQADEFQI